MGRQLWCDGTVAAAGHLVGQLSGRVDQRDAFGITTVKRFRRLMKKHRRSILDEERTKMSRVETLHVLRQFDRRGIDAQAR